MEVGKHDASPVSLSAWIEAARPRTLPLSLSSIVLGSCLAAADGECRISVVMLAAATTLLLQILSNFANDYGDFVNGKDAVGRVGPRRMMQSGIIMPRTMVKALTVLVCLTLATGTALILVGLSGSARADMVVYFLLGVCAIVAALKYTVGRNPYGYRGFGDLFVFVFFGLVGTVGTYYLHTHQFRYEVVLPAASIGLLSVGVLNINNLRDEKSDRLAKKRTLVIILGSRMARLYHVGLVAAALALGLVYTILNLHTWYQFVFVLPVPILLKNASAVLRNTNPVDLTSELKRLSLATLLFAFAFGLGAIA